LDKDSEGLILMTNDGRLTNQLTHPRYQHEKEYRVQVNQKPNVKQIRLLQQGISIGNGEITLPAKVSFESQASGEFWLRIILTEGKKRQIRRMLDAVGLSVQRLIRVRIAALNLKDLDPGMWRELSVDEVKALKQS
jgi:23S rRNA pseudouridine2605 synthase